MNQSFAWVASLLVRAANVFAAEVPAVASPRIALLRAHLDGAQERPLQAFWNEVRSTGSPLVEIIPGDDLHRWVTFLWKGNPDTKSAIVHASLDGAREGLGAMQSLANTDVWYRTYRVVSDARFAYSLAVNERPAATLDTWPDRSAWRPDPLNPRRYVVPKDEEDTTDVDFVQSMVELPAAPPRPLLERHAETPQGKLTLHHFKSGVLANERRIWVYTPAAYDNSRAPSDVLIVFDGGVYLHPVPTPLILDNLIARKRIPPTVAVFVDSLSGEVRGHELTCSALFTRFLAEELVPWVRKNYRVTSLPGATTLAGSSYGGLAAAFAAMEHPELFGNVLSQSGAFWWAPEGEAEPEWLTRRMARVPKSKVLFDFTVGRLEDVTLPGGVPHQVVVNRHLRDVLLAKGYSAHYEEVTGSHQYLNWESTLGDGLARLRGPAARHK